MTWACFDDLLYLRAGGDDLTMGSGPSCLVPIDSESQWQAKAGALRAIFRQTLGQAPGLGCPLAPEVRAEENRGDHLRRTIVVQVAPGERITALVLIPRALRAPAPGVLCIHPTTPHGKHQVVGDDASPEGQERAYALHLVRRGYVTLAYDLISAGERCYPGCRNFDTTPFYRQHPEWSVRGRDLWDVTRALDLLQVLPEVDPARLGSVGHSQGGGITIQAMALDERIKAGVSSCGDWPARISKNPFNHARTGWWVGRPFLRPYCVAGKPFPIDLHECLALAAPRSLLNIVALNDWQYALEEEAFTRRAWQGLERNVRAVYSLHGVPERYGQVLHTGGHGFAPAQRELAYAFLDAHLGGLGARPAGDSARPSRPDP